MPKCLWYSKRKLGMLHLSLLTQCLCIGMWMDLMFKIQVLFTLAIGSVPFTGSYNFLYCSNDILIVPPMFVTTFFFWYKSASIHTTFITIFLDVMHQNSKSPKYEHPTLQFLLPWAG